MYLYIVVAPKPKSNTIKFNVSMVEHSSSQLVHTFDNIVCICEGKQLCGKEIVFDDFLTPCISLPTVSKILTLAYIEV